MERLKPFIIVADDGGYPHPAIEKGIREAASKEVVTGVDYLIEEEGAVQAALVLKSEFPHVSIGLHVDIAHINDYAMTTLAYWCRWKPNRLFQREVLRATEHQLKEFQDKFGYQPAHLSTHGNVHLDHHEIPYPWFVDLIERLSEGDLSDILVRGLHTVPARHTRARELLFGKNPLTPRQFQTMLESISTRPDTPLELVVHPARKTSDSDPPLRTIYTLAMRERDLDALIEIINKGVIRKAGYRLLSPEMVLR